MARLAKKIGSGRRLIARVHLWIGLILCIPLVVLGLTGSMLVVGDALGALLDRASSHPAGSTPRPVADLLTAAQGAVPDGFVPATYIAPRTVGDLAAVRLVAPDARGPHSLRVAVDPVSLQIFKNGPAERWLGAVHALHSSFLLQDRQMVGWLGIAMLALGASGLVNWWPRPRRWRAAFVVRGDARGLRLHRDLHGAVGIWASLVFMTVSFGGVYMAFPRTVSAAINLVLPARDLRLAAAAIKVEPIQGATPMSVDGAIALAEARLAGTRVSLVSLPIRPDQPMRVSLLRGDRQRGAPAVTVFVDPWSRRIIRILDPRDDTAGETILAWQHALHSGEGLGRAWKLLVFLSGFLPLLFVVTGVSMWWHKRRLRAVSASRRGASSDQLASARRAAE